MPELHDRPETQPCAKGTRRAVLGGRLGRRIGSGGLLIAAVIAGIFLVDPPIPIGRLTSDAGSAPGYVPASERWIELKAHATPGACEPAIAKAGDDDAVNGSPGRAGACTDSDQARTAGRRPSRPLS